MAGHKGASGCLSLGLDS